MAAVLVSRPWRRYQWFSVRGLTLVILVAGVGLGWVVRIAQVQRDAVAAIVRAGGSVECDWRWRTGPSVPVGRPSSQAGWLILSASICLVTSPM